MQEEIICSKIGITSDGKSIRIFYKSKHNFIVERVSILVVGKIAGQMEQIRFDGGDEAKLKLPVNDNQEPQKSLFFIRWFQP